MSDITETMAEAQQMTAQSGETVLVGTPGTNITVPLPVVDFVKFPKIPRLSNIQIIVTEKIDGTNAQVVVPEDPAFPLLVGSRNRWITPGKGTDNFGFATFVKQNEAAIRTLGPGTHYGEWFGCGIGRDYGLSERRWLLFNIYRPLPEGLPANIGIVPLLLHRQMELFDPGFSTRLVEVVEGLRLHGSRAVPGFMQPEGVVVTVSGPGGGRFKHVFDKTGPSPEQLSEE